jgi:hypothetical protein
METNGHYIMAKREYKIKPVLNIFNNFVKLTFGTLWNLMKIFFEIIC